MASSYLRLRRLFGSLAASSLATGAVACDSVEGSTTKPPFPPSSFETNTCGTYAFDFASGFAPTVPVDATLLRTVSTFAHVDAGFPSPSWTVVGTACATATDVSACETAVDALPPSPVLYRHPIAFDGSSGTQLAFTRGDTVELIESLDELLSLLVPIETANEAYLLGLVATGHGSSCGSANARAIDGGFEILLESGTSCGEGTHRDQHLVRVMADGAVTTVETRVIEIGDPNCVIGRLTDGVSVCAPRATSIGEHLARMAALEAAAVVAFERLADEMVALGAPAELVARARRSARDEARHVAIVDAQRVRFGAAEVAIDAEPARDRSAFAIALENAREGMVRETYGALAATYHAAHATDPELARMFGAIAIDETRHAALAIDFGRWIESTLSDDERHAVVRAREAAAATLADEVAVALAPEVHDRLGWPEPNVARSLIAGAFPSAWN